MHNQRINALRAGLALAVLVSAAVHLYVYVQGFSAIPIIGPLFLANVIGGAAIAVAVGLWRHWIPPLLAAGFGLSTVAAYWVSVIHGLFGVREVTGGWPEIVSEVAEYAAVVLGVTVAAMLWRQTVSRRTRASTRQRQADPADASTPAPRKWDGSPTPRTWHGMAGRSERRTADRTAGPTGVPGDAMQQQPRYGRTGR